MHLDRVRNQNGVETVLVRESFREGRKVRKRTIANLTHLPAAAQAAVAAALAGETLVPAEQSFEVVRSRQHGHVDGVLTAMRRLKLDRLLGSRPSRERSLVMAMVAGRVLSPASKLSTVRQWEDSTLPQLLDVEGATEDELYHAMDWLLEAQPRIEKKLAQRHLENCGLVLYDLTSTYVEGEHCPLAARGHSRDRKPSELQINFGMLTDEEGRPVSVTVFPGNTADASTVTAQIAKVQDEFGIEHAALVGDRGMIAQTTIEKLKRAGEVEWITALKSQAIRQLQEEGALQLGLFDERNLFELTSPRFPGERFVACRNEQLMKSRRHKRTELIEATRRDLVAIRRSVTAGRLRGESAIGLRVGRVINRHKVAKHFKVTIEDERLTFRVRRDSVEREASLDGIYVVRTSIQADAIPAGDVVRHYKRLTKVERAFRSMKSDGLEVRPIFHRTENRVRAHIFLCMLAYYVRWHMEHAWRSLTFAQEVDTLPTRDPVKAAKPTLAAREKKARRNRDPERRVWSFRDLVAHLAAIVTNECRAKGTRKTFELTTKPNPVQAKALALLAQI